MKKIIVSVTNDLSTDQRVDKVCSTLQKEGYEIVLIGRKLKNSIPLKRSYNTKRIKLIFNKGFLFYAEFNFRLFFVLLFSKKDVLLSNDLDTLLPNYLVSILQKKKIIYDSHELFPEIPELVHKPFVKKCWTKLEAWILPKLKNTYTVCNSIADFYDKKYNMLYINPGAAGIVGFHKVRTIIRFELHLETIKNLEVIELKKRSDLSKSVQRSN